MKLYSLLACVIVGVSGTAASSLVMAQAAKSENVGAWELRVISDPITDESRTIGIIKGGENALAIKCDSPGQDSVYVHFIADEYLGEGRYRNRDLTQRFGDAVPVTQNWSYDGRGAILTSDRAVDDFSTALLTADRLALRATTFEHHQVTALFALKSDDTGEVLRRVYAGCSDTLPALTPSVG
ncbi:hypothetical protein [Brevundimonas intermedia]|uniref:hypothetical protein n=1 Tax=Brevundimonas intermedia TaxID=74315 RepID=UPI00320B9952